MNNLIFVILTMQKKYFIDEIKLSILFNKKGLTNDENFYILFNVDVCVDMRGC